MLHVGVTWTMAEAVLLDVRRHAQLEVVVHLLLVFAVVAVQGVKLVLAALLAELDVPLNIAHVPRVV